MEIYDRWQWLRAGAEAAAAAARERERAMERELKENEGGFRGGQRGRVGDITDVYGYVLPL